MTSVHLTHHSFPCSEHISPPSVKILSECHASPKDPFIFSHRIPLTIQILEDRSRPPVEILFSSWNLVPKVMWIKLQWKLLGSSSCPPNGFLSLWTDSGQRIIPLDGSPLIQSRRWKMDSKYSLECIRCSMWDQATRTRDFIEILSGSWAILPVLF